MSLALTCTIGKAVQWDVALTRDGVALPLPAGTKLWFTVKRVLGVPDADALLQVTEVAGISIIGDGSARVRLEAVQTALLSPLVTYYCDLQVQPPGEDPDIPDDASGTLLGSHPATTSP